MEESIEPRTVHYFVDFEDEAEIGLLFVLLFVHIGVVDNLISLGSHPGLEILDVVGVVKVLKFLRSGFFGLNHFQRLREFERID